MKTCKRKYHKHELVWNYKSTDKDGSVFYFKEKPHIATCASRFWSSEFSSHFPSGFIDSIRVGLSYKVVSGKKDWKKSLRKIKD
jgi:hypothetical protein